MDEVLRFGDLAQKAALAELARKHRAFEARVNDAKATLLRRGRWPKPGSILRAYPQDLWRHGLVVLHEASRRIEEDLEQWVQATRRLNRHRKAGYELTLPPGLPAWFVDGVRALSAEPAAQ